MKKIVIKDRKNTVVDIAGRKPLVDPLQPVYFAFLEDSGGEYSCGESPREAMANLIWNNLELFGLEVIWKEQAEAVETKPPVESVEAKLEELKGGIAKAHPPADNPARANLEHIKELEATGQTPITDDAGWVLGSYKKPPESANAAATTTPTAEVKAEMNKPNLLDILTRKPLRKVYPLGGND